MGDERLGVDQRIIMTHGGRAIRRASMMGEHDGHEPP